AHRIEEIEMSNKISVQQLQDQLVDLLDDVAKTGREYVVQREGKDCAVLVSAGQWRRGKVGLRLEAPGAAYHLADGKQRRGGQLLAGRSGRGLTTTERRELRGLLRECDEIMQRRAAALDQRP